MAIDLANGSFDSGLGSNRVKFTLGKIQVTQILFKFGCGSG